MPAVFLTILLIPIFWVMIIRPQQQRQRQHRALVDSLVAGDRVEGFSGIHGTITEVRDQTVRIEVAEGVVLTMARLAVASKIDEDEDVDEVEDHADSTATGSDHRPEPIEGDPR